MKKVIMHFISFIAIILTLFISCFVIDMLDFHIYWGWKDVKVNNITFKVPQYWEQGEKNGLIYFYDKTPDNIVLFQSNVEELYLLNDTIRDKHNIESNIISDEFESIVSISGTTNSIGVTYGKKIISVEKITYLESYIYCCDDMLDYDLTFYEWNQKLDDELIEKIADSFAIG